MVSVENGRYKIVTDKRELLLPACSMFNRADSEPYYVDTDYDVEEGRIYIGASDIEDMARTIGWVNGEEFNKLKAYTQELENKYDRLISAFADLSVAFTTIRAVTDSVLYPPEESNQSYESEPELPTVERDAPPTLFHFELPEPKLEGFDDPFAES